MWSLRGRKHSICLFSLSFAFLCGLVTITMDLSMLSVGMDQVAPSGVSLSTEHRVALQTSLLLLKNAEKFSRVTFWGKIRGVSADYYIAQGYTGSEVYDCKSFYRCARTARWRSDTKQRRRNRAGMEGRDDEGGGGMMRRDSCSVWERGEGQREKAAAKGQ